MSSSPRPECRYVYRHIWPIVDEDRPLSALRAEATAALDVLAARTGARLVGDPVWTLAGDRLTVEVPAQPCDRPDDAAVDEGVVLRLVQLGWADRQIAAELGWGRRAIAQVRQSANLPPACGVRELTDETVVQALIRGEQGVQANRAERELAIARLKARGADAEEIGERVHVSAGEVRRTLRAA